MVKFRGSAHLAARCLARIAALSPGRRLPAFV